MPQYVAYEDKTIQSSIHSQGMALVCGSKSSELKVFFFLGFVNVLKQSSAAVLSLSAQAALGVTQERLSVPRGSLWSWWSSPK